MFVVNKSEKQTCCTRLELAFFAGFCVSKVGGGGLGFCFQEVSAERERFFSETKVFFAQSLLRRVVCHQPTTLQGRFLIYSSTVSFCFIALYFA